MSSVQCAPLCHTLSITNTKNSDLNALKMNLKTTYFRIHIKENKNKSRLMTRNTCIIAIYYYDQLFDINKSLTCQSGKQIWSEQTGSFNSQAIMFLLISFSQVPFVCLNFRWSIYTHAWGMIWCFPSFFSSFPSSYNV